MIQKSSDDNERAMASAVFILDAGSIARNVTLLMFAEETVGLFSCVSFIYPALPLFRQGHLSSNFFNIFLSFFWTCSKVMK